MLLSLITCMTMVIAADLSPANWPPDEKTSAERREQAAFPPKVRAIEGRSALIAATLSPIAIRAGIESLKQGGTAADAASTIALTQVTTALGSYVSYAGILQLVYYDSRTRKLYSLDAGWNSYLNETAPNTIPANATAPEEEGRKTLVPGFLAGIEAMHKRVGRLPFASLFQPAIWYAANGVTISPLLGKYFASREKVLARTPEGRTFLHQAGEHVPKAGDRFIQTDLAQTLRAVAKHGAAYMYTGEWGRQFVEAVRQEGGQASLEDMRRYRPLCGRAAQHNVRRSCRLRSRRKQRGGPADSRGTEPHLRNADPPRRAILQRLDGIPRSLRCGAVCRTRGLHPASGGRFPAPERAPILAGRPRH